MDLPNSLSDASVDKLRGLVLGRRPPGPGHSRPHRPVSHVWRLGDGLASLVPTGPGGGTWARVRRRGPISGGAGQPVGVGTLDALGHPVIAHMDGFPMRFAICHWAGLPVGVVTRVAIAASVRPVARVASCGRGPRRWCPLDQAGGVETGCDGRGQEPVGRTRLRASAHWMPSAIGLSAFLDGFSMRFSRVYTIELTGSIW